jgi:hypothetical protein
VSTSELHVEIGDDLLDATVRAVLGSSCKDHSKTLGELEVIFRKALLEYAAVLSGRVGDEAGKELPIHWDASTTFDKEHRPKPCVDSRTDKETDGKKSSVASKKPSNPRRRRRRRKKAPDAKSK